MTQHDEPNFDDFLKLISEIEQSEGERVYREIDKVKASVRLVKRNYDDLVNFLNAFGRQETIPIIWDEKNRDLRLRAIEEVDRLLHNFLASAFTLVDHVRRHRTHLYRDHSFNAEIDTKIHTRVLSHPHHRIAQGLRDYCIHVSLAPVSINLSFQKDQMRSRQ